MTTQRPLVLLLFETTGLAAREFERSGFRTICVDLENSYGKWDKAHRVSTSHSTFVDWDILKHEERLIDVAKKSVMVGGFPPCTDLAVSGALHFASKRLKNPKFQEEAVHLCKAVMRIGSQAGVPWWLENPVSVLSTLWRKPNYLYHPHEYGGYLRKNVRHPLYPQYIKPQDAYPKKTCLWTSDDFVMPEKRAVPVLVRADDHNNQLGGKSARTKRIRSATPRGVMRAIAKQLKETL